jgi:indolepyruvate ferredoxin oxidoreductase alpha subunit
MTYSKNSIINANEAIAWAALSAEVNYVAHYPGSPVNNVEKFLKKLNARFDKKIVFNDSINEHVAALAAAGASYCGAKTLVVMKHVGLNIAADPFNYIGYTGVKGPMVIVVGTDPGANSSTGEEDVHWFIPQFNFPLFEPTSIQECYDFTKQAYKLSEKHQIPVVIFLPGRLAYDYASIDVSVEENTPLPEFYFEKNRDKYINVGQKAVTNHKLLLDKIELITASEKQVKIEFNPEAKLGIMTRGLAYPIVVELINKYNLSDQIHLINFDLVYPLNSNQVLDFIEHKTKLVFIEDQDGFLENQLKMNFFNDLNCHIEGKSIFPKYGEITFKQVEDFLIDTFDLQVEPIIGIESTEVPERLGTFCEGCSHRSSFFVINEALKEFDGIIGGDIGCSSLAPFMADWLLCMNAGIGISQGMAQLGIKQTILSTGGDGSFFHAGALSLLNAVENNIDLIHLIFDNSSIAMTGHQDSPTTKDFDFKSYVLAMGVTKVVEVSAYKPREFILKLKEEINTKGVKVFWVKGECVIAGNAYIESRRDVIYPEIDPKQCKECTTCYTELACPAIINLKDTVADKELKIDLDRCVRCGVCYEICPTGAITINNV